MRLGKHFKILVFVVGIASLLAACVRGNTAGQEWHRVEGVPNTSVTSEIIFNNQVMYVGTNDQGVYVTKDAGATWQSLGLLGQTVLSLQVTRTGRLFAVTNFGLYQYDHGKWLILYLDRNKTLGQPSSIVIAMNKIFATGMLQGVYQFDLSKQQWIKVGAKSWPASAVANQLIVDSKERIFVGTMNQGIYKYENKTWQAFNQGFDATFLWAVNAFAEGNDDQLYVATSRAVYVYDGVAWQQVGAGTWPLSATPRALYVEPTGNIYVVLTNGGLYQYDAQAKIWHVFDTGTLPSQQIYGVGRFNGVLYVGTDAGLFFYKN